MHIEIPFIIYPLVIIGLFIILRKTGIWYNPFFNIVLILLTLSFITYELIKHYETGYRTRPVLLLSLLFAACILKFYKRVLPHFRKK